MVFDVLSFLVGFAAGAITGALAGILHGLESTADLQERLRHVTGEVEKLRIGLSSHSSYSVESEGKIDDLDRDLKEIHEEIRRMYKRTR